MTTKLPLFATCVFGCLAPATSPVAAQPRNDGLERVSVFGLRTARAALQWDVPAEPARVVGPIYFVGTKGLGSFLITGSAGHVVLYTGMPGSGQLIEKS